MRGEEEGKGRTGIEERREEKVVEMRKREGERWDIAERERWVSDDRGEEKWGKEERAREREESRRAPPRAHPRTKQPRNTFYLEPIGAHQASCLYFFFFFFNQTTHSHYTLIRTRE